MTCSLGLLGAPARASAAGHAHASRVQRHSDDVRARKLYRRGDRAYAEGRYEDAAADFEKAYELSHRPLLLFNLANAYERAGHYHQAAAALSRYLPHAKPGERNVIRDRLHNLEKRAAKQANEARSEGNAKEQASAPPQATAAPSQSAAAPSQSAAAPSQSAAAPSQSTAAPSQSATAPSQSTAAPSQSATAPPQATSQPKRQEPRPVAGYVLLGAGGAAITAGVVFGALALDARRDEQAHCSNSSGQRLCTSAASDAISRDQRWSLLSDISVGVGVVAAGVGAYLVLGQSGGEHHAHSFVAVGASARPGGGELSFAGRF